MLNETTRKAVITMRFISRGALLALGATLALSGFATASASASSCPGTGEGVELCSEGHVLEGTFAFTGKIKSGTLDRLVVTSVGKYECSSTSSKGELVASAGKVEVVKDSGEWTGCHLSGSECTVKPIVFGPGPGLTSQIVYGGETDTISFAAAGGEKAAYAEFSVTNCEQESVNKVTGTQGCKLPHIGIELVKHELVCEESKSNLHDNNVKSVGLAYTEELQLSSGKSFSLQKG